MTTLPKKTLNSRSEMPVTSCADSFWLFQLKKGANFRLQFHIFWLLSSLGSCLTLLGSRITQASPKFLSLKRGVRGPLYPGPNPYQRFGL